MQRRYRTSPTANDSKVVGVYDDLETAKKVAEGHASQIWEEIKQSLHDIENVTYPSGGSSMAYAYQYGWELDDYYLRHGKVDFFEVNVEEKSINTPHYIETKPKLYSYYESEEEEEEDEEEEEEEGAGVNEVEKKGSDVGKGSGSNKRQRKV